MNRKKILVCLNGNDDAQLEQEFIEQNLDNPHNLVVKFHLESIDTEELVDASASGVVAMVNPVSAYQKNLLQTTNRQDDTHIYGNNHNRKRQMIFSNSVKELLAECQFADLLLIRKSNYDSYCNHYGQKKALKELIKKSECPILVIPDLTGKVEQILLIYDGTPHALAAIKMLRVTLTPFCRKLPVTVIIPTLKEGQFNANQEKMLIEYFRLHFKDLGIHKVCDASVHTLQFAIYPDKNLLMVVNQPDQQLPDFLKEELEVLTQNLSSDTFQFLIPANH